MASLRDAALRFGWQSGLTRLARRLFARRGAFVLELHGVARRHLDELPRDVQPSFCRDELAALLSWLGARFPFLAPHELFAGAADRGPAGVLLTFDDGFANQAANALPLLEEHAAPAVFFVTTRHVRDPKDWLPATRRAAERLPAALGPELERDFFDGMSEAELRAMAASPLVTIGSHTASHPFLTRLSDRDLALELGESKRLLEEATGRDVSLLAYPTGDYDLRVVAAARAAGYRAAFVEESRRLGGGLHEIPRIGVYSAEPAYLGVKLSGLHRRPLRGLRLADHDPS